MVDLWDLDSSAAKWSAVNPYHTSRHEFAIYPEVGVHKIVWLRLVSYAGLQTDQQRAPIDAVEFSHAEEVLLIQSGGVRIIFHQIPAIEKSSLVL